jgi:hypothetical protein
MLPLFLPPNRLVNSEHLAVRVIAWASATGRSQLVPCYEDRAALALGG